MRRKSARITLAEGEKMKKADILALKKAAKVLNSLSQSEYDRLLDVGCEPMTAEHSLDKIIEQAKGLGS